MALTTIFEEQSVAFYDSGEGLYGLQASPAPFVMIEGDTYTVMWDGTEYVCTCVNFNPQGVEFQAIGNRALAGGESSEEPFLFLTYAIEGADPPSGCILTTTDTSDSHTIAVYQGTADEGGEDEGTEEEQEGIITYDRNGNPVAHYGIETLTFDTTTEGKQQKYTKGIKAEKTVELSLADGDQTVEPDEGTLLSKVTITKPETLVPENIAKDVYIAGIGPGTHSAEIALEGDFLKYVVYQIDMENKVLTVTGILYGQLYADTGGYEVTIPDTFGDFSVEINSEGVV